MVCRAHSWILVPSMKSGIQKVLDICCINETPLNPHENPLMLSDDSTI